MIRGEPPNRLSELVSHQKGQLGGRLGVGLLPRDRRKLTLFRLKVEQIKTPSLFISATKDQTLRPEMAANMERHFKNLTRGDVVAGHWALWEAPAAVNKILEDWFEKEVFTSKAVL
jgi:pimeloyl-ACP methyl ester carboxylesterase